jgi:uncharacterized protein YecT (DUF1311 family)
MLDCARAFLLILFLGVPLGAEAGGKGFAECANLVSTGEQKACAEEAFKASRQEMDAAYQAAIERASEPDRLAEASMAPARSPWVRQ